MVNSFLSFIHFLALVSKGMEWFVCLCLCVRHCFNRIEAELEAPASMARLPKKSSVAAAAEALVVASEAAVACNVSPRGGVADTGTPPLPPAEEDDEGEDVPATVAVEPDASSDCQSLIFLLSSRLLWCPLRCRTSSWSVSKHIEQKQQLYRPPLSGVFITFLCTEQRCFNKWAFCLNMATQRRHANGFSPV